MVSNSPDDGCVTHSLPARPNERPNERPGGDVCRRATTREPGMDQVRRRLRHRRALRERQLRRDKGYDATRRAIFS